MNPCDVGRGPTRSMLTWSNRHVRIPKLARGAWVWTCILACWHGTRHSDVPFFRSFFEAFRTLLFSVPFFRSFTYLYIYDSDMYI